MKNQTKEQEIKIKTPYGDKNWSFVKRCFDSHDALVEALEELLHGEPDRRAYEQAEAVLKAAKGEA